MGCETMLYITNDNAHSQQATIEESIPSIESTTTGNIYRWLMYNQHHFYSTDVYIYNYIQKSQELLKRLRHNQLQGKREPWAPQARAPICKKGKSLPIFWLRFYLWHSLEIGILSKTLFFNLQIFPFTFEDFHLFPECSTSITFRLCWLINYLYSLD